MEPHLNGQPSSPQAPAQTDRSIQPLTLILVLAMAAVLFFVGLGATGLTDRDEGRNAEAGREMYETGNYISPTFNYEPRFAKPVFVYWLMSLSYHAFGVNEFAARFPSALFGLGLILLQYLFLTRCRGPVIGLFGAAMLLLNLEIIGLGRMALTDSVLIFFTTLSLYGFWLGLYGTGRERHYMWLFYIGMALGTLTKGPIGFSDSSARRGSLPLADPVMVALLAPRISAGRPIGVPAPRTTLVSHHAEHSRAAVHNLGTRRYSRPILRRHGRTRWHSALLSARTFGRVFSLERLVALCLVPGLSKLARLETDRRAAPRSRFSAQ